MTVRYCDPAASGDNDGTSWINAYETFQQALDNSVVGDICYCRGTETYAGATTIDIDTNSGTNAGGVIKIIGCNASGNQDGTRFVLDVNSQDCHGLTVGNIDLIWLENIEIKNAGGAARDGIYFGTAAATGWVILNCSFHNNSRHGLNESNANNCYVIRSTSYSNGSSGVLYSSALNRHLFCSFHDNTGDGATSCEGLFYGCLFYDNGDDGFDTANNQAVLIHCVINGNADDGLYIAAGTSLYQSLLLNCRVTNQSGAGDIGVNANSEILLTLGCYFEDNDGDNIQNATLHLNIPIDGTTASSNAEDQADTNEGYTDKTDGAEDFNLRSDATLRRTAISIPLT